MLARSTGVIFIGVVGLVFLKKLVERSNRFFKIFKYVFYSFCSIIIVFLPLGMIVLWKPYVMHCETKLDRTDAIPKWCLDELPNVYNYIQKVYWDVKFMGFLDRKLEHFLVALPMNIFLFYVTYRFIQGSSWNFLTFGVFSINERNQNSTILFQNPALIPIAWHFIITMFMVVFMANIDVSLDI